MNPATHIGPIKAEQMREIASRNPTAQGLLLYFALNNNESQDLYIPAIKNELNDRGVNVDETQLYDGLQELEELGLGTIISAKNGGPDVFKRNYDLTKYANRAFPQDYIAKWKIEFDRENEELKSRKIKLVDPNFKFQQTGQEKLEEKKHSTGKRGRPKYYSLKLKRNLSEEEMKQREIEKANKPHYSRPGRPKGWRKFKIETNAPQKLTTKLADFTFKGSQVRKPGRPAGSKNKSSLTAQKLNEHMSNLTPPNRSEPVGQAAPQVLNGNIMSIPLGKTRFLQMQLPDGFNKKDLAMVHLILENMVDNS